MHRSMRLVLCAAAVAFGDGRDCLSAQQQRRVTAEDITGLRNAYDVQLSPDGRLIAFVIEVPPNELRPGITRRETVWIVSADGETGPRQLTLSPNDSTANTSSPRWLPDSRHIAVISEPAAGAPPQVYVANGANVATLAADSVLGAARRVTFAEHGVDQFAIAPGGEYLAFTTQDSPTAALIARRSRTDAVRIDRELTYTRLWTVSLTRVDTSPVLATRDSLDVKAFAWAPQANALAVLANTTPLSDAGLMRLVIVDRATGRTIRQLSDAVALTNALRWSPDAKWISFIESPPGNPNASWLSVISAEGGRARALLKDSLLTVLKAEWLPDSRHLLALSVEATHQHLSEIDVARNTTRLITRLGTSQAGNGFSTNGRQIAYFDETPTSPVDVWIMGMGGEGKRQLSRLNPQTASWLLGRVWSTTWKSSVDGTILHGVVVAPPGYTTGRRYPTIVECHPGDLPWWEGFHGYWWSWGQLLASHGYVVFLPNYRGVTGQGWRFHNTIGDWGGLVSQDINDGLDVLIREGVADPNALGIGGWSNGGFVTEWTITHTARFKAAIAEAGHSDMFAIAGTSGGMRSSLAASLGGTHIARQREYDAHSPVRFITRATAPTLVLHGGRDGGVPVGQGYEFYYGLRSVGVEAEMVVYPGEGHAIQSRGNQVDLLNRVVGWFDAHLQRRTP